MIDLIREASVLQDFLESKGWDFFFIGGVAVQIWGQPRLTQDIDLTVFTNLRNEPELVAEFLKRYKPKFSGVEHFALTERILPMFTESGIGIDLTLGGLSDTSEALTRSTYQRFVEDLSLRICSADDLIIMKTVAARPRDWIDVESVVIRQEKLDWDYIISTLNSLTDYKDLRPEIENLDSLKLKFYQK